MIIRSWKAAHDWNEDLVNLFLSEVKRQDRLSRIEAGLSYPVDTCLTWSETERGSRFWDSINDGRVPREYRKDV